MFFIAFYFICKSTRKGGAYACLFVYNCVFFDKKVKINFFLLEGGDLSSKPKAECPLLV